VIGAADVIQDVSAFEGILVGYFLSKLTYFGVKLGA
jgi:hypothetical protein